MILLPHVPNDTISYLDYIHSHVALPLEGPVTIRNIFIPHLNSVEAQAAQEIFRQNRQICIEMLCQQCLENGGNAIIGFQFQIQKLDGYYILLQSSGISAILDTNMYSEFMYKPEVSVPVVNSKEPAPDFEERANRESISSSSSYRMSPLVINSSNEQLQDVGLEHQYDWLKDANLSTAPAAKQPEGDYLAIQKKGGPNSNETNHIRGSWSSGHRGGDS